MGLREYARYRNVRLSAVQRAIASGRIETHDGKIDPVEADRQWDLNTDQAKQRRRSSEPPNTTSRAYLAARTIALQYAAASIRTRFLVATGRLVDADLVAREWFARCRMIRDGFLNIPDRLAGIIAAESDPARCHSRLKDEIERIFDAQKISAEQKE